MFSWYFYNDSKENIFYFWSVMTFGASEKFPSAGLLKSFLFFLTLSLEILRDQHFDSLEIPKEKVPNIFFNKPEKISCGFIPRNMVFQNVRKVQENKAKNILGSYDTLIKNTIPNARKKEIFL